MGVCTCVLVYLSALMSVCMYALTYVCVHARLSKNQRFLEENYRQEEWSKKSLVETRRVCNDSPAALPHHCPPPHVHSHGSSIKCEHQSSNQSTWVDCQTTQSFGTRTSCNNKQQIPVSGRKILTKYSLSPIHSSHVTRRGLVGPSHTSTTSHSSTTSTTSKEKKRHD